MPALLKHRLLSVRGVSLAFALALLLSLGVGAASAAQPQLTVVARGLSNPRKIFLAPDGAVYVVEAGNGGRSECLGKGANETCLGTTASILRIEHGKSAEVVTGLVSFASPNAEEAEGPSDVLVRGNSYDILFQDADINSKGVNPAGPIAATAGDLISTPAGKVAPRVIANFAAFEAAHNPDHGAGPGAKFGDPSIDSDPYAFTPYRGGYAVADAAGNDLLWVNPKGKISVLAVFPTQTEKLTKAIDKTLGVPTTLTSILVQSVPTCVAVGPDGALYVGELTGAPFEPGTARIWRVTPGQTKPALYASGFTNISDLAFDGQKLLVLEIAERGLLDQTSSGALIRLTPGKQRRVLLTSGLVAPTGLAIGHGLIYISNYGIFPGTGKGPHGELDTLPASIAS